MLTIPHCKESLSRAYITAVVGRSQNNLWWNTTDYGTDGIVRGMELRGQRHRENGSGFDFQAKSTIDWEVRDTNIIYDLEAKSYNDLVERAGGYTYPFYLILLCLSQDDESWLRIEPDRLILQNCAYWIKLTGPSTTNTGTKRISIPISNIFNPNAVTTLLNGIQSGNILP